MSKICHIFYASEHSQRFMPFFRDSFPEHNHSIVFAGGAFWDLSNHLPQAGVLYVSSLFGSGAEFLMRDADLVLFHSLFCREFELPLLLREKALLEKSMWIPWGGDLFCATDLEPVAADSIEAVTMPLRLEFMRQILGICAPAYEYSVAVQVSGTKASHFEAYYPPAFDMAEAVKPFAENRPRPTGPLTIWIGNSAAVTNRHLDAFEQLRIFYALEDFRVICPLSYGSECSRVIQVGRDCFGSRFEALEKVLPLVDFMEEMDRADVVFFNHHRTQGFGTALIALLLGKFTVVASEGTRHWLDARGLLHFDLPELLVSGSEYLRSQASLLEARNRKMLFRNFSNEKLLKIWRRVFSHV
jgi:dTDP-N-acetylfucosamine:lipid II N-acetylfucosaminyltransferase